MTQSWIRRIWWQWRLRVWERRLHRANARVAAREEVPVDEGHWLYNSHGASTWVVEKADALLRKERAKATLASHRVALLRKLLWGEPWVRLVDDNRTLRKAKNDRR